MSQPQPRTEPAGQTGERRLTIFQRFAFWLSKKTGAPKWDPQLKRLETQWRLYVLVWFVIAVTTLVVTWVLYQPVAPAEVRIIPAGVDLAVVLAPVLAAAAGIERFLETIFGILEGNWRTLVAYLGRGLRWLHNAESEVESARQWLTQVQTQYKDQLADLPLSSKPAAGTLAQSGAVQTVPSEPQGKTASEAPQVEPPKPQVSVPQTAEFIFATAQGKLKAARDLMDLAEQRLKMAEDELSAAATSDNYKNAKRAASIYMGLLIGLIVATASSLQMLALMGVTVSNAKVDVVITGLVIGSGSAPVHSLINILQSAKDTLESTRDWLDANKNRGKP